MTTYKIPDLDRKVAFVVGHCEFQRVRQILIQRDPREREPSHKRILDCTKQRAIAEQLCVSPSQWSRMKKGQEAISDAHLARLSEYLDVDRSCDFLVWVKPYDVLTNTLTALGYGRLRYRATGPALKDVLDSLAEPDGVGLRIVLVANPSRAVRGIGSPIEEALFPVELYPGAHVRIAVADVADLRHLVLLSQEPGGQFTVLAPTASGAAVQAGAPETLLPGDDGTYPVGRPFGPHRLYAILTRETVGLESRLNFSTPFPTLSEVEEDGLRDEIAGRGGDGVRVRCLGYEVIR